MENFQKSELHRINTRYAGC